MSPLRVKANPDAARQFLRNVRAHAVRVGRITVGRISLPAMIGEFWTSRQRQASPLHEVSYRACFKPQLPRFFIDRLTRPGDVVYDPFSGRGTTVLEAGLLGRRAVANDINPLSPLIARPRFFPPTISDLSDRLDAIRMDAGAHADRDLSMFFHRRTEAELVSLRRYLLRRSRSGTEDDIDRWIRMVATNRLTGHSRGFFSVYTLPPNQAVQAERQRIINRRLRQKPEYRDVRGIILRKTRSLLRGLSEEDLRRLADTGADAQFLTVDARQTDAIGPGSVRLTVTSPPFLNIVDYAGDNWLRCWFNGLDAREISARISTCRTVPDWSRVMGEVFRELFRITGRRGWVAFEVGEVRNRTVRLEEAVIPLGIAAGFTPVGVLINTQRFTKTSNIWGIENNRRGTNTNRIVVFRKE